MQLFQNFIHDHVLRMREQYETADIDLPSLFFHSISISHSDVRKCADAIAVSHERRVRDVVVSG